MRRKIPKIISNLYPDHGSLENKKIKLINPKVIFILFILASTCYDVLNMIDEPIFSTNIVSLCFQLLIFFALPISLIVALLLTEKESKNKIEKRKDKEKYSIYDIGPFFLGITSISLLENTSSLDFPLYQLALFSVLAVIVILIANSVRGGTKLL